MRALFFAGAMALLLSLSGWQAQPPGRVESAIVIGAKHFLIGGRRERNPLPATAENIHAGQMAFTNYCFACHGLDGQNTGVPFAEAMSPPVPSLASIAVQSYSDGQLKSVMENGILPSGMPPARGILHDEEMWAIVLYIRHLPPRGSLGELLAYGGATATPKRKP